MDLKWPDLLVLAIVAFSAWTATRSGFVAVTLSLVRFFLTLFASFTFYPYVAVLLTQQFGWPLVWTRPAGFILLFALVGFAFSLIERLVVRLFGERLQTSRVNRLLAVVPGALQGLLTAAVILTLLALLPLPGALRRDIRGSNSGSLLTSAALSVERPLDNIFGPAAREAQRLIPSRPPTQPGDPSSESVQLQFTVDDAEVDPTTEEEMLQLVNRERTSRGLVALEMDPELRLLARTYANEMFRRGYFAHNTPEGLDPFDRMRAANIIFGLAGENLALAPTLDVAHNGLMNSPGHRANILKTQFRRAGIGVMDGGIYGKMFVQEFTD
jgi:uncharacterized protein YkwD/uncharacterized membrane protein required for colicin V production